MTINNIVIFTFIIKRYTNFRKLIQIYDTEYYFLWIFSKSKNKINILKIFSELPTTGSSDYIITFMLILFSNYFNKIRVIKIFDGKNT